MGRLVYLNSDVTGCSGVATQLNVLLKTARAAEDGLHPIVLLERSVAEDPNACSFEDKVLAVQDAGAMAAVVFDNVDEGPVQMVYAHPASVDIPAAFVSFQDGMTLLEAMANCHGGEPVALLAPSHNGELAGEGATARFEFVSFTTGYLLLFACLLPVAAVSAARHLKRRQDIEAAYAVVQRDPTMAAQVASQLDPKHLPLPAAWDQKSGQPPPEAESNDKSSWASVRRFLSLAIMIYVLEMLFVAAVVDKDGAVAAEDPSVPAAALYGVNCVINALLGAAFVMAVEKCVRCLCCCDKNDGNGAETSAAEGGTNYPGAASRAAREAEVKQQAKVQSSKGEKRYKPVQAELSVAEYVELAPPGPNGYTPPTFFLGAATTEVNAQGHCV